MLRKCFPFRKRLFIVTVTMNKKYLIVTVTMNKKYLIVTVTMNINSYTGVPKNTLRGEAYYIWFGIKQV